MEKLKRPLIKPSLIPWSSIDELGSTDPSYFSRAFGKEMGAGVIVVDLQLVKFLFLRMGILLDKMRLGCFL